MWGTGSCPDGLVEKAIDLVLVLETQETVRHLAVLEHDHGWDGFNLVLKGKVSLLVDVHFGKVQLVAPSVHRSLQARRQHLAGATPGSAEVDDNRFLAL